MKKLLKSGIYGSVNNVRVYYSPWKSQQKQAGKKKKKRRKRKRNFSSIQTAPMYGALVFFFLKIVY